MRSVTQTPGAPHPVWAPGVIRDTKIFVSRCLEATGSQGSPPQCNNPDNPSCNLCPRKACGLFELFMIFLFDHKVSFNWARSRLGWLADSPSSNSSFIAVHAAIYRDSLLPGEGDLTQHVSRLLSPPGELWPSWNLSGSDWHFGHMDGLTPKKLDPNKMLTQEAKWIFSQSRNL